MMKYVCIVCCLVVTVINSFGQRTFIYTKEGKAVLDRGHLLQQCLHSLHKDRTDETALSICECQLDKMDRHFTNKQFRKYTSGSIIDINGLINEDSIFQKEMHECYQGSGKTILLQAEGFETDFITDCINNIRKYSERKLDSNKLASFCSCQLNLVKTKKLTDEEMKALENPNSLLFYEMMYKCGDPFADGDKNNRNWNSSFEKDISGPEIDTINILNLGGMTFVKAKTGDLVQFWLFDTGASDVLVSKDMEDYLKAQGILTQSNYIGTGEYEMANGMIDTCRKYLVNGLQIGKFKVDNVIFAVTDKGKKIIIGRSLLNKFSNWILNNKNNTLVLTK